MRRIKIILSTAIVFLLLASGIVFNACVKDPCDKMICKNSGVCRDGRCKCTTGFEGVNCEIKMYEKFIGTWDCSLRINGSVATSVTLIIAPGSEPNKISVYNIFAQAVAIDATVDVNHLDVPLQSYNNIDYQGNGNIEGTYLTLFLQQKNNSTGANNVYEYNGVKFTQP